MSEGKDICGYDEFMGFDFVTLKLPTDVIEQIAKWHDMQERLSLDGMYALVLREGIRHFDETLLDLPSIEPQYRLPKHIIEERREARGLALAET